MARQTGHSTTVQAAQVAEKAGARRLLIGHFSSRYKDESLLVEEARGIFAAAEAAVEGASYEIPLKRVRAIAGGTVCGSGGNRAMRRY